MARNSNSSAKAPSKRVIASGSNTAHEIVKYTIRGKTHHAIVVEHMPKRSGHTMSKLYLMDTHATTSVNTGMLTKSKKKPTAENNKYIGLIKDMASAKKRTDKEHKNKIKSLVGIYGGKA